jgi:RimJ/RimL family protein N-acetyltransferase
MIFYFYKIKMPFPYLKTKYYKMDNIFNTRLEVYTQDELDDKIDTIIEFIHKILPDENFDKDDFLKLYGNHAMYKNIYLYYHLNELIGVSSCNFYYDEDNASVLEEAGEVIVYLMVIAIHENYQNKGVGSNFLKMILDMNNQSNVWIKIHKENTQSQAFFKKNDFEKVTKKSVPSVLAPSYRKPYDVFVHYKSEIPYGSLY